MSVADNLTLVSLGNIVIIDIQFRVRYCTTFLLDSFTDLKNVKLIILLIVGTSFRKIVNLLKHSFWGSL